MVDTITLLPDPPARLAQDNDSFVAAMDAFLSGMSAFGPEMNAAIEQINDAIFGNFRATSTDSVAVGTGTKSFPNTTAGVAFVPGQSVIITSEADPANFMSGAITEYIPGTGALTVEADDSGGSGTHADWIIGLLPGSGAVLRTGDTMTGLLTLAAALGVLLTVGAAPASPTNGQLWSETTNALSYRWSGTTRRVLLDTVTQAMSAKTISTSTLVDPTMQGTPTTDGHTIPDGAGYTIDPANGEVQQWVLGASRTPTLTSITSGKAVAVQYDDGSAYTVTHTGVTWMNNGGIAPNLKSSGWTTVLYFNILGTLYGWVCGDSG